MQIIMFQFSHTECHLTCASYTVIHHHCPSTLVSKLKICLGDFPWDGLKTRAGENISLKYCMYICCLHPSIISQPTFHRGYVRKRMWGCVDCQHCLLLELTKRQPWRVPLHHCKGNGFFNRGTKDFFYSRVFCFILLCVCLCVHGHVCVHGYIHT